MLVDDPQETTTLATARRSPCFLPFTVTKSALPVEVGGINSLIGPRRAPVPTTAAYMPPNGFSTVSLLVTEVTPGTPFAISATVPTWEASVTVPLSVTAPSFATTLILPALISLCFTMALYTCRRSARFALRPVAGAAEPDAVIADAPGALAGSPVWDHAVKEVATSAAPTASLNVFIEYSGRLLWGLRNQKVWRMPTIAAVVFLPGATGVP
jgi:hypothetical protein